LRVTMGSAEGVGGWWSRHETPVSEARGCGCGRAGRGRGGGEAARGRLLWSISGCVRSLVAVGGRGLTYEDGSRRAVEEAAGAGVRTIGPPGPLAMSNVAEPRRVRPSGA